MVQSDIRWGWFAIIVGPNWKELFEVKNVVKYTEILTTLGKRPCYISSEVPGT